MSVSHPNGDVPPFPFPSSPRLFPKVLPILHYLPLCYSLQMLPILKSDRRPQKCQTTVTHLPSHIDASQPPQKRKPFDALWALNWCHTVDVLLPAELRDVIARTEARQIELGRLKSSNDKYAKVIMKLGDVLEGSFFNEYIKRGEVVLSNGDVRMAAETW